MTIKQKLNKEMTRFRGNSKAMKEIAAMYDLSLKDPGEKSLVCLIHAFLYLISDATLAGMFPVELIATTAFTLITSINDVFDKDINFQESMQRKLEALTPEQRETINRLSGKRPASSIIYPH